MSSERLRLTAIFSSIWTLLQGVLYLAISAFGLSIYDCTLNLTKGNKLQFIIYFIYFFNDDCRQPVDLGDFDSILNGLIVTFSTTPFTAVRTYDWFFVYAVISGLWIITSSILFFGAILKTEGTGLYITVTPWVLTTVFTLFADAIAAITYAIDIPHTLTWDDTVNFIGATIPGVIQSENFFGTWIPSALMVIFFSRAFIFWFINISILIAVIIEGNGRANKIGQDINQQVTINQFQKSAWPGSEIPTGVNMNPQLIESMRRTFANEMQQGDNLYATPAVTSNVNQGPDTARLDNVNGSSTLKKEYEKRQSAYNANGPDELRSQLPWSYFQDRNDPTRAPRRITPRGAEDSVAPPVPVPDYTLHFPKRPRDSEIGKPSKPSRNLSNENGSSHHNKNNYARQSSTPSMNPYG